MNPFTVGQSVVVGPQAYKPGKLLGSRGIVQRIVGDFCVINIPEYGVVAFLTRELLLADDECSSYSFG